MRRDKFLDDILKGLQSDPKYLMSKYFYDARGDKIFQQIMHSKEYYPTRAEMKILKNQSPAIAEKLCFDNEKVDVIELGAGDAIKSVHLVKALHEKKCLGTYIPIDISPHIISLLHDKFEKKFHGISIHGLTGEYFQMLPKAVTFSSNRKVILFLGGNIGNFLPEAMEATCKNLFENMSSGDKALIGFDLKKDPRKILAAYNDKEGLTANFNLNLLRRINRELDADFQINQFSHYPTYNPCTGSCQSFLISEKDQQINIADETIFFEKGEAIFTEISQKLNRKEIAALAARNGFVQKEIFTDDKKYFADIIWEKP